MTRLSERIHRQKGAAWWFIVPLFLCMVVGVFSAFAAEQPTYPKVISLNGAWQRQVIDQFSLGAMKPDKWSSVQIPSMDSAGSQHFIAYRRSFENPVHASVERLLLHFNGVAFACKIFVNGTQVGEHGPTLEPFDIEIPSGTLRGDRASQELVLLIQDWTSGIENLYAGNSAKFSMPSNLLQNKNITLAEFTPPSPFDPSIWYKTISPMGAGHGLLGIWDDVWLEVFKGVRVEDVAVESLVVEGKIRLTGQIQNMGNQAWAGVATIAFAEGGDSREIVVGPIAAGQSKPFQVILDAKGLTQWEPNRPVLYDLKVDLREVSKLQIFQKVIPFGYRSITVKNHEIFLNGRKLHLFTSSNSHKGYSPAALEEYLKSLKKLNINAVRFHANVFPDWYYSHTDRFGFLVVAESALNGSYVIQNNYNSDLFFENAAVHWQGLVRKFRNHPSIIAYSIENEAVEYSHGRRAEEKFAELGRKVKAWDSTRPILFNGSDDPGGVADIISLHYPHELPFWNQYPREAWWLRETGMYIDSFWYQKPDQRWAWNRKKPLDIGEIGYFDGGEPIMDSILFGDAAYAQGAKVRDATQGEVWKHSIEAARALDLAMINPWNPPAGPKANEALKDALKPVKLILFPEATKRYYEKSQVNWQAVIVNDTGEERRLILRYSLLDQRNNKVIKKVRMGPYIIPPGEKKNVDVEFICPAAKKGQAKGKSGQALTRKPREFQSNIQPYSVRLEVIEEKQGATELHDEVMRTVSVYPDYRKLPWRSLARFDLYDPAGAAAGLLTEAGTPFRKIDRIEAARDILVVGPRSFGAMDKQELEKLRERLSASSAPNKATLVMEQKTYPLGFSDGLTLNERHGTTLGFIAAPGHDVFKNVGETDLQLWAKDLVISRKDFNLPIGGGYRALVVGGGSSGLLYAPLLERQADGAAIFSQLGILENFAKDPAAAQLLFNMINYLDYRRRQPVAMHVEMPSPFKDRLKEWGVAVNAHPKAAGHALRVIRAFDLVNRAQDIPEMVSWVEKGNVLWLTGLYPEVLAKLRPLTDKLQLTALKKEQLPAKFVHTQKPGESKLIAGLLNQFLYWTEPYPLLTYQFAPLIRPSLWALEARGKGSKQSDAGAAWKALTLPSLIMTRSLVKGRIIVDTIDWDNAMGMGPVQAGSIYECRENRERAARLFCGLMTNFGASLGTAPGLQIEGENMAEKTPGQPIVRNRYHDNWSIFKNNYIAQEFEQDLSKVTAIEVKARNRMQIEKPPIMRVVLNGRVLGEYAVKEPVWHLYRFDLGGFDLRGPNPVPKQNMKNRLEIHLVNNPDDAYNLRYLNIDWVRLVN